MKSKLNYLEGLRGLAAVAVMLNHLQLTFAESRLDDLLLFLESQTNSYLISRIVHGSVNVFFNGELAVFIFWLLSAYVISIKLFTLDDRSYLTQAISKRYVRLAIPVIGSILMVVALLSLGLMFNIELAEALEEHSKGWLAGYYGFRPDLLVAIKSGLWYTFFDPMGGEDYNPVLWTMNPELYGSLVCFTIYGIFARNKLRFLFYFLIAVYAFFLTKYWLITFILGHALCDVHFSKNKPSFYKELQWVFSNKQINIFVFVCLIILGGFYNYYEFFYVIISALIVLVIIETKKLQLILEHSYLVWLGKISFSLYLLHLPIIFSFSCYLYLALPFDHLTKVIIVCILTVLVSFLVANCFTKYVDGFAIRLANKVGIFVAKHDANIRSKT